MIEDQAEHGGPREMAEKVHASIVHLQRGIFATSHLKEAKRLRRLLRLQQSVLATSRWLGVSCGKPAAQLEMLRQGDTHRNNIADHH